MKLLSSLTPLLLLSLSACSDVEKEEDDHHHHDHEVMTAVVLHFTADDGTELEFTWSDADNDADPVIDDIVLQDASDYTLSLSFLNELEDPIEDVTPEIADEDDEHQVFITGSAVDGPATESNADALVGHAYADEDVNGLPIGLDNDITTLGTGSGEFTVTLRHMPLQSGNSIKTESAAGDVASGGFSAIGGDNDVQVTFDISVE
ncbi:MAG: hypothetical protein CL930_07170 [Deltaproteobacteria bacterium]|nr:hypothetical protein [Deltaproteobacteria bacterium]MAY80549.1 hypothetical protein [Deltaproteobacteria bacterium]|tara:strand:- start:1073 stop:1687 length:615 start_codon:yes stop_codon:yes gene_type:complete